VRRFAPQLSAQLFCIPLLFFVFSDSKGQVPSRPTSQEQVQYREWALGNLQPNVNTPPNDREKLLAQLAIKRDFRDLQMVNNQLMARVFEHSRIDSQEVSQKEIRTSLSKIRRLAERLRLNFNIPKTEPVEPANDLALNPGLLRLDKAVMSFVDNPLFQQTKVYDSELASRAGKDLTEISILTDSLRKLIKQE
jgi:hypothetical protein